MVHVPAAILLKVREMELLAWHPGKWEAPDRKFIGHRDILTRSLARYRWILPELRGPLLEIGCGRGYGLEVLSEVGSIRVGVDLSLPFLREAQSLNREVSWVQATGSALPFKSHSFHSIVALEVIEHIPEDRRFIENLIPLVRKGGIIVLSTPNRQATSAHSGKPLDPFHVREYTADEFAHLLKEVFPSVSLYGQRDEVRRNTAGLRFLKRVPERWKYLFPAWLQGLLSVALRPPLRFEECIFSQEDIETAHTFLAICRIEK